MRLQETGVYWNMWTGNTALLHFVLLHEACTDSFVNHLVSYLLNFIWCDKVNRADTFCQIDLPPF